MKLVQVHESEVLARGGGRRGRISWPILKMFMESNIHLCMLDREGLQQTPTQIAASIRAYAVKKELPVKVFQRGGEVYLQRTDIDSKGNPIPKELQEEISKRESSVAEGPTIDIEVVRSTDPSEGSPEKE